MIKMWEKINEILMNYARYCFNHHHAFLRNNRAYAFLIKTVFLLANVNLILATFTDLFGDLNLQL